MTSSDYVPDWMTNVTSGRIKDTSKDHVTDTIHRLFLGSMADAKQPTVVENVTTQVVNFDKPQATQIISTQFKPSGRGIKEEIVGIKVIGAYGVTIRVLDGRDEVTRPWQNYPHKKGAYGHINLLSKGRVVATKAINYAEETILCSPIMALLEQLWEQFRQEVEHDDETNWLTLPPLKGMGFLNQ